MAQYKTTRNLQPEVAAYIAGLIDGEGTITLTHRHANERRQLVISIANTDYQETSLLAVDAFPPLVTAFDWA